MKKALFCIVAFMLTLVSCEGPAGPMGPEGPAGYGTNWQVYDNIVVNSGDWELIQDEDGSHPRYIAEITLHDLTDEEFDFVYTDGSFQAYVYKDMGIETQTPLPYIVYREAVDNQGNYITWEETYDFDYSPGSVAFYATYSDFFVDQRPPSMTFRVILMW